MARELGRDAAWITRQLEDFRGLAAQYNLDRTEDLEVNKDPLS
jgi:hypothetical protein